jgi:hypothetical protein
MSRTLPLDATISLVALQGFGPTVPNAGIQINDYHGHPLYCHTAADAGGNISITVDEVAPSTFTTTAGPVTTVTVNYQPSPLKVPQSSTVNIPAGSRYNGTPLEHHLAFTRDLTAATLLINQLPVPASTANSVGIVIVGSDITGGAPEGYFVSVPLNVAVTNKDPMDYISMGISWTPAGGIAGPIGGATVP